MNDDTISRQMAIDELAKFVPHVICDESTESYTNGLADACNLICQLPSAERHGRWMQEEYIDGEWYHTCSSCGMSLKKDAFGNFCGNCGAKMDEVEDEQNG